jgi:hypothetical protein
MIVVFYKNPLASGDFSTQGQGHLCPTSLADTFILFYEGQTSGQAEERGVGWNRPELSG